MFNIEPENTMSKEIDDFISKRTQFLSLLDQDIGRNQSLLSQIEDNIQSLEKSRQNIVELSQQPERTSLIPLCKRLYMPGSIVHTGEYLVTKKTHPTSYHVLKTQDQTIKDLESQILEQRGVLEKAQLATSQLGDRKKLLLGEKDEDFIMEQQFAADEEFYPLSEEVAAMPNEIRSEKGVAMKVGGFFEIVEYEEVG